MTATTAAISSGDAPPRASSTASIAPSSLRIAANPDQDPDLDRRHAVPALAEPPVSRHGVPEPPDQLVPQFLRLHDAVQHQVRSQPLEIDVLLILTTPLGDVRRPLILV